MDDSIWSSFEVDVSNQLKQKNITLYQVWFLNTYFVKEVWNTYFVKLFLRICNPYMGWDSFCNVFLTLQRSGNSPRIKAIITPLKFPLASIISMYVYLISLQSFLFWDIQTGEVFGLEGMWFILIFFSLWFLEQILFSVLLILSNCKQ